MGYFRQFENFEPKKGPVPWHPFSMLPNIVSRARSILWNRSSEEIKTAASSIDEVLDCFFREEEELFIADQLQNNGWACKYIDERAPDGRTGLLDLIRQGLPESADEDDYFEYPNKENTPEQEALKLCIDNGWEFEDQDFQNPQPEELFAVLALWYIGDSLRWLNRNQSRQGDVKPSGPDTSSLSIAGEYAIRAMDAVCFAERLRAEERQDEKIADLRQKVQHAEQHIEKIVEAKVAHKRSAVAREAAAKRHEEHDLCRQDVIQHYEENQASYKSVEAAARAIAGKLVPMTHRTVVEWIRAYKKQQSAGKP